MPYTLDDLESTVSRQKVFNVRERFLQLNQQRLTRTRDALPHRQRVVLDILPLLFHTNHPALPGYVSHDTPCGLSNYTPGPIQLEDARRLARSFRWNPQQDQTECFIHALFMMGSPGTIAHSEKSDIDMWVCHKPGLGTRHRINLEQKCQLISTWADKLGLELHFFLIDPDGFRSGEIETLSEESSGSAQHYLLLDEFYRTAVWVGGRTPLWWYVPPVMDNQYEDYCEIILRRRGIDRNDVIDLGGISEIPPDEFIGAAVWQLYKGIDSPYKSIIKLLLLEIYAREYPNSLTLCQDFKNRIYDGQQYINNLDPYVLTYHRLEEYLKEQKQSERLELVRRCFYFKIDKQLTKSLGGRNKSWQRRQLETMTQSWGWTQDYLRELDCREDWKANIVIVERNALVAELVRGYRLISRFSQQNQNEARISKQELAILGRKLHAAFERKSGKLERINPSIAPDLSEPYLTLANIGAAQEENSWELHKANPNKVKDGSSKPLKQEQSLLSLLGWCQLNGILAENTRCEILDDPELTSESNRIRHLLASWLPAKHSQPSHTAFTQRSYVRSLLLVANIGIDPQAELTKRGMHRLSSKSDSLSYSGLKENLVQSLDSLIQTSWHEYIGQHFRENPVVDALMYYLSLSSPNTPPPELDVRCLGNHRGNIIQQRLMELFTDVASWYHNPKKHPTIYIFEEGQNINILRLDGDWPEVTTHKGYAQLLMALSTPHSDFFSWTIDRHALRNTPLPLIADVVQPGCIQVFFQYTNSGGLLLLVVDEKGSLFHQSFPQENPAILAALRKFFSDFNTKQAQTGDSFSTTPIHIYEVNTRGNRPVNIKQVQLNAQHEQPPYISLQVNAVKGSNGGLHFNLSCDHREFSQEELGDDIYNNLSGYIKNRCKGKKIPPCFVTAIELNHCDKLIDASFDIQTSHLLRIKSDIERKMTQALHSKL